MRKIILLNFCFIGILTLLFGCKKNDSKDVSGMTIAELQTAADNGNSHAMAVLGALYETGEGEVQDYSEALKWYRKAADKGDAAGQFRLGFCYIKGRGVPKDYSEGVKWFNLAANAGLSSAQTLLGDAYCKGLGVKKDEKQGFIWYQKAAQNQPPAQYSLGMCYRDGIGTDTNADEAFI